MLLSHYLKHQKKLQKEIEKKVHEELKIGRKNVGSPDIKLISLKFLVASTSLAFEATPLDIGLDFAIKKSTISEVNTNEMTSEVFTTDPLATTNRTRRLISERQKNPKKEPLSVENLLQNTKFNPTMLKNLISLNKNKIPADIRSLFELPKNIDAKDVIKILEETLSILKEKETS